MEWATMVPWLVILIRLMVPLSIFRFPLWGAIASAFVDLFDVVIFDLLHTPGWPNYTLYDKLLDTYYLTFLLFVSLKWEPLAKRTSIILYIFRLIGVAIVEFTGLRWFLFVFPNLFENFYWFYAARNRYFEKFDLTKRNLAWILLLLLIPKLIQEYLLHVAVLAPWDIIKNKLPALKSIFYVNG